MGYKNHFSHEFHCPYSRQHYSSGREYLEMVLPTVMDENGGLSLDLNCGSLFL